MTTSLAQVTHNSKFLSLFRICIQIASEGRLYGSHASGSRWQLYHSLIHIYILELARIRIRRVVFSRLEILSS